MVPEKEGETDMTVRREWVAELSAIIKEKEEKIKKLQFELSILQAEYMKGVAELMKNR